LLVVALAVFGVGWALLPNRPTTYAQERSPKKAAPAASAKTSQAPTTLALPKGLVTLRVDFKSKGKAKAKQPTVWDGRLSVSQGRVRRIRAWQDDPRNQFDGDQWRLTTRRTIPWNSQQRKRGHEAMPLQDGAMLVELADVAADTQLEFETEQGDFRFAVSDVSFGTGKRFLSGLVEINRVASAATILSAPTEDDYPSAALGPDGRLQVAYVAFTHGEGFRKRPPLVEPPKDFGYLDDPTGGDQVLLLELDGDEWTGPLPVTPPGQDVYRTAVAVDGNGRVWVFWSANRDGNWDLYARRRNGDQWSQELRLTTDPGPDTFPVATTDVAGRVWVAWQAFREGSFDILTLAHDGDTPGDPIVLTDAPGNQWTPAIAASSDGQVAVAWDSYEKGNYDVHARIRTQGKFGDPIPVATSLRGEMRASITFDKAGRLWIAYEDSPEKWGKDWGALEKEGSALYQGRTIAVRVWAESQLQQPADDPVHAFVPWLRNQKNRKGPPRGQRLAVPRLTTDAAGRVWLAVRSPRLGTRVGVGTVWFEHVAWYEGDRWSSEIICPGTDNLLDNRPALVPRPSGEVVMVTSSDNRFATAGRLPQWLLRQLRKEGDKIEQGQVQARWPDPVNNELVMAELGPAPGSGPLRPELVPTAAAEATDADADARKEADDVARVRAARATVAGKTLRLLRGEFHRHTEISSDGGGDGLLLDMWRYAIDAASHDWIGNGDHDNGNGREYSWWITQKTTDLFHLDGAFTPMFTYERSCSYPDGHRNVVFDRRGIRTLPRLKGGMGKSLDDLPQDAKRPNTPDTQNLYRYLAHFDGVCASHTSGTDMGTDWRDGNAKVEPIVEIYQGCRQSYEMPGAPRSNTAENSIGGWRPFGFVSLALRKGFRLGFQASSDHTSTHISYCNVWVEEPTREAILAAMKARRVFGSTDNIVADVRSGDHFMGEEFTTETRPSLQIHLAGTQPFAKVHVIKDGDYVHTAEPGKQDYEFEWTDFAPTAGATSYYYVRGEQEDGELVWVSPMWITYKP
ncbi:MAG: hypothetical protein HQ582_12935, partial [Planctomycetes bacterium]|nr:hypothetical protein [Planctomycetota bacterium]